MKRILCADIYRKRERERESETSLCYWLTRSKPGVRMIKTSIFSKTFSPGAHEQQTTFFCARKLDVHIGEMMIRVRSRSINIAIKLPIDFFFFFRPL